MGLLVRLYRPLGFYCSDCATCSGAPTWSIALRWIIGLGFIILGAASLIPSKPDG